MIRPIKNNVLVKPFPSDEFTQSGLFVPENAREVNNKVRIVAVGEGTANNPMVLKPGATAYRVLNWGTEIFIDGEQYFLMDKGALLAQE